MLDDRIAEGEGLGRGRVKTGMTASIVTVAMLIVLALLSVNSADEADALGNGISLGAYAQPINGQTNQRAIELLEHDLGTTLPMVRAFELWDDRLGQDKPLHRWVRDGGRDLMVSVKAKRGDGSLVRWAEIANAQPGSLVYREMQNLASGAKRYEEPMILGFHHEPEQAANRAYGSSSEFRDAYRALRAVFDAEGVNNVHFAWIMTDWSFEVGAINPQDRRRADFWYPGDDVVDMIASDTYNWDNCRGNTSDPWTSLEDDLAGLMRFSAKHPDKPLILAEVGSDEGPAGEKATWIEDAHALFKSSPYAEAFAAILYFHDDGREEGWPECDWWLNSSSDSLAAARDWISDPFFRAELSTPGARNQEPFVPPTPTSTTPPKPPVLAAERCDGRPATIVGTSGSDKLNGTPGSDVIHGRGGDDIINGLGGDDIICGGEGHDTLSGGGGSDVLFGGAGADMILGGFGPDTLVGGTGPDRMNGQHGNDTMFGNEGNDVLRGGPHADVIRAGLNRDVVFGQGGSDQLFGGEGNDRIEGGVGRDTIVGGRGNDTCFASQRREAERC